MVSQLTQKDEVDASCVRKTESNFTLNVQKRSLNKERKH